jgi:hypothetical protein
VGTYNYQVVQPGSSAYEVECYALLDENPTGSLTPNIATFENCINQCDIINTNSGVGACQGVSYNATIQLCLTYTSIGSTAYPYFDKTARSARLIYPAYSFIKDAFYLQHTPATEKLGLCINQAYTYDAISPQWESSYDNLYENECDKFFGGYSQIDSGTVQVIAKQLPGNIQSGIQTTEDCLKVCDYANHLGAYYCVVYAFELSSHTCNLFQATDGLLYDSPGVNGGRLIKAAVGYASPTDRPPKSTYRSMYQWATPTSASSTSIGTSTILGMYNSLLLLSFMYSLHTRSVGFKVFPSVTSGLTQGIPWMLSL